MLAYEAVHRPYDWNCFPLGPPGCKAVIYEAPESQDFWASHGTDVWYIGPSRDHYPCNHFFVPDTRAYQVSSLAELFPQHYQVPFLMWNKHLQELIDKFVTTLTSSLPKNKPISCPVSWPNCLHHSLLQHHVDWHTHKWLLPREDIQLTPYVPPSQQVNAQRLE